MQSRDTFSDYLQTIGRVSLLTADDEIRLGKQIQAMLRLKEDIRDGKADGTTPQSKRIIRAGERAHRRMIEGNLRLVVSYAKKYNHLTSTLDLEDRVQEGNIGLMRAVEKFDPERGYKFSTYAYWWIRQSVGRAVSQQGKMIRLPCSANAALKKARTFMIEHYEKHGDHPSTKEIAEHCEVPEETMRTYLRHVKDCTSLDQKARTSESDGAALIDLIAEPKSEESVYKRGSDEYRNLLDLVEQLPEKQSNVIKMRFGLDNESKTLRDVGRRYGVSREAARQIETRSLRALRYKMNQGDPLLGKIYA